MTNNLSCFVHLPLETRRQLEEKETLIAEQERMIQQAGIAGQRIVTFCQRLVMQNSVCLSSARERAPSAEP